MSRFEFQLDANVEHVSGPVVEDADHVAAWIVADGMWYDGRYNEFRFTVCSIHADPEECECPDGSVYRAMITSVDVSD